MAEEAGVDANEVLTKRILKCTIADSSKQR